MKITKSQPHVLYNAYSRDADAWAPPTFEYWGVSRQTWKQLRYATVWLHKTPVWCTCKTQATHRNKKDDERVRYEGQYITSPPPQPQPLSAHNLVGGLWFLHNWPFYCISSAEDQRKRGQALVPWHVDECLALWATQNKSAGRLQPQACSMATQLSIYNMPTSMPMSQFKWATLSRSWRCEVQRWLVEKALLVAQKSRPLHLQWAGSKFVHRVCMHTASRHMCNAKHFLQVGAVTPLVIYTCKCVMDLSVTTPQMALFWHSHCKTQCLY